MIDIRLFKPKRIPQLMWRECNIDLKEKFSSLDRH
jgi:hypothetical protein